jgi:ABC-type transport system involved in multi-copper enzyme maturation permease subunit
MIPVILDGLLTVLTSPTAVEYLGKLRYVAPFQRGVLLATPVLCVVLGAQAIGGARSAGYLKTTALQPVSRTDILVGKITGRTVAVIVPLLTVLTIGVVHGTLREGVPPLTPVFLFAAVTTFYALVLMSAMIGVSALFDRAITPAGIAFVSGGFVYLFYDNVLSAVLKALFGVAESGRPATPVGLTTFLRRLPPTESYFVLTNWVFGLPNTDSFYQFVIYDLTPDTVSLSVQNLNVVFQQGPIPIYLQQWVSVLILALFGSIPLVVGHLVFKQADIQ